MPGNGVVLEACPRQCSLSTVWIYQLLVSVSQHLSLFLWESLARREWDHRTTPSFDDLSRALPTAASCQASIAAHHRVETWISGIVIFAVSSTFTRKLGCFVPFLGKHTGAVAAHVSFSLQKVKGFCQQMDTWLPGGHTPLQSGAPLRGQFCWLAYDPVHRSSFYYLLHFKHLFSGPSWSSCSGGFAGFARLHPEHPSLPAGETSERCLVLKSGTLRNYCAPEERKSLAGLYCCRSGVTPLQTPELRGCQNSGQRDSGLVIASSYSSRTQRLCDVCTWPLKAFLLVQGLSCLGKLNLYTPADAYFPHPKEYPETLQLAEYNYANYAKCMHILA